MSSEQETGDCEQCRERICPTCGECGCPDNTREVDDFGVHVCDVSD
jgi:hypothetical protein